MVHYTATYIGQTLYTVWVIGKFEFFQQKHAAFKIMYIHTHMFMQLCNSLIDSKLSILLCTRSYDYCFSSSNTKLVCLYDVEIELKAELHESK